MHATRGPHEPLPIVFLDIDDVLCLNDCYGGADALAAVRGQHSDAATVLRRIFARQPARVLHSVHDAMQGQLRYVISSSWREVFSRAQIERVFDAAGLGCVVSSLHPQWSTPVTQPRLTRVDEIGAWLREHHHGEPFVVLDDDFSGGSLAAIARDCAHPWAERVLLCRVGVGLCEQHADAILVALRRPCAALSSRR